MSDPAAGWGGPQDMSAWEALMWRAESDPRTSSTGILLELLEGEPEWSRLVQAHRRTVQRFPRLRERVVEPTVPLVQPAWSAVPDFDVADHLHRVELAPGQDLLHLCEEILKRPLDPTRPPWEGTLITGLPGGGAAYSFRFHHSLTDGLGLMQLLALAHAPAPDSEGAADAVFRATAARPAVTAGSLLTSRLARRVRDVPSTLAQKVGRGMEEARRASGNPWESAREGIGFVSSLRRMLSGPPTEGSPLLAERTTGNRFVSMDVDLDALKLAARAAGGSVNDAFVAGALGGLRRFHETQGVMVDTIPVAMPISLRQENDPLGGNRFAGARIAAPLAQVDPAERIRTIRECVLEAREEPAIGFVDHVSPALTKLPTKVIIELSAGMMSMSDLQISNIRGLGHEVYLAGQRVTRMYPLGPRPGVAAMIAMITYDGTCCLGLNVDPHLFPDIGLFEECMADGFAEVIALGQQSSSPVRKAE